MEVRDETMPSLVVTMTVTIWRVEVETTADVKVVFEVLLVGDSDAEADVLVVPETGSMEVDSEV